MKLKYHYFYFCTGNKNKNNKNNNDDDDDDTTHKIIHLSEKWIDFDGYLSGYLYKITHMSRLT